MKNILIVTESPTLRSYLQTKLESYDLKVMAGNNGLDGMLKLRNRAINIDLVIMDYNLTRVKASELLSEKQRDPNTSGIPLIVISGKIDKSEIVNLSKMNVKKICSKPIKIDSVLKAVSEIIGVKLEIDATKCMIDTHMNEDILFIEVAHGLNREKTEILSYKIKELAELYNMRIRKVLVIMSNIDFKTGDVAKLDAFLIAITEKANIDTKGIKILTSSAFAKSYIEQSKDFGTIEVFDSMEKAMDRLTGLNVSEFITEGKSIVMKDFIASRETTETETFHLQFQEEAATTEAQGKGISIAIVDDDMVAQTIVETALSSQKYATKVYENGRLFLDDLANNSFDLLFLDLMMPEVDGFGVLAALKEKKISMPIIILSALSQKETVMQAMKYGVHSYIIKPVEPQKIVMKTKEILQIDL
jgi:DNA-binding response OmpR family regulator